MVRHRTHSIELKRQVAHDYVAGETLHGLAKRHDLSRNLIRIWVQKYEAGAFDDEAAAVDLIETGSAFCRLTRWATRPCEGRGRGVLVGEGRVATGTA